MFEGCDSLFTPVPAAIATTRHHEHLAMWSTYLRKEALAQYNPAVLVCQELDLDFM